MRFTKYNNPSNKKAHRKPTLEERTIMACNAILADRNLGYEAPTEMYNEIYRLGKESHET